MDITEEVFEELSLMENIERIAKERRFSLNRLSEEMGKSKSYLSKAKAGAFQLSGDEVQLLAEILQVHEWEITGDDPPPKRRKPAKPEKPALEMAAKNVPGTEAWKVIELSGPPISFKIPGHLPKAVQAQLEQEIRDVIEEEMAELEDRVRDGIKKRLLKGTRQSAGFVKATILAFANELFGKIDGVYVSFKPASPAEFLRMPDAVVSNLSGCWA